MLERKCVIGREVEIGYTEENNARTFVFHIGSYQEKWPGTEARMLIQRQGDTAPYYVETEVDGDTIRWTASRYDTERPGMGMMWIAFVAAEDEVVGLTPMTPLRVLRGPWMITARTAESRLPPWIQKVVHLARESKTNAEASAQSAESSAQSAEAAAASAKDASQSAEEARTANEQIPQTIEAALQAAKDSGEFDGPAGPQGTPGMDGVGIANIDITEV